MGRTIDLEHHPFSDSSFPPAAVLDPAPLVGGPNPLSTKNAPDFLTAQIDRFLFFKFLGQVVIVKTLVFSQGQPDDPFDDLVLDLTLTRPPTVTVNHSLGSDLVHPRFDPVTLPFADVQYLGCLNNGQFAAVHSLYYV